MPRPLSVELAVGDVVGDRKVVDGPALRAYGNKGCRRTMVKLQCKCGTERWAAPAEAMTLRSCGCSQHEDNVVHGYALKGRRHPLYTAWASMKQRCTNPKNPQWHNYGGRGISVCEEWLDAAAFLVWAGSAGWAPGLQLDRIDNDGDYTPGNCRFVTPKVNSNNRRSHGKTLASPRGERHSVQSR